MISNPLKYNKVTCIGTVSLVIVFIASARPQNLPAY